MDIYDNAKKSILLLSQIQADDQPCEMNTKSEMWEGYSRHDIDFDQINNLIFFDSGLLFRDGVGAPSIKTYEEKKKQFSVLPTVSGFFCPRMNFPGLD